MIKKLEKSVSTLGRKFNPRREREKVPKSQNSWEGPYRIVKKLSEIVFRIRKSAIHKCKIIHSNRLASFIGRLSDN